MNYEIKDSGSRREFETGSQRDAQEGKGRYDLIPPMCTRRLAKHYENGAKKYSARNWELGQKSSVYIDCAKRHIDKYLEGMRDEDHLAAAVWNIFGLIFNEEMIDRGIYPSGLNDLPDYTSAQSFTRTVQEPTLAQNAQRKAEKEAEEVAVSAVQHHLPMPFDFPVKINPKQKKGWDEEVYP